jgi:putative DNA primase/helicase
MNANDKNAANAASRAKQRAAQAEARHGKQGQGQALFTPEEVFAALYENEHGDACLLVKAMRDRFTFDTQRERFYRFKGGYWQADLNKEALAFAGSVLREAYGKEAARQHAVSVNPEIDAEGQKAAAARLALLKRRLDAINTRRRLESVLVLARTGDNSLAFGGVWNADPYALQAGEALIDLKTGEARPGLPADFIHTTAPTEWRGMDERCDTWRMFLQSVFDGDGELIAYAQRFLGAALLGVRQTHEFFVFFGHGRNGKSTLLETLLHVLGEDLSGPVRSDVLMETRQEGNVDPVILSLRDKRLVWCSETRDNQRLNSERIKTFTGGDTITARSLYVSELTNFRPVFTLILSTNYKPKVHGGDTALWQRLRLVGFRMSFVPEPNEKHERPMDPELKDKLAREASGILAWLVQGCIDARQHGLKPPASVTNAVREYRLDESALLSFIKECCHTGEALRVQAGAFYTAFSAWFKDVYGEHAAIPSLKRISGELQRLPGITREEGSRHTFFHGFSLTAEDT